MAKPVRHGCELEETADGWPYAMCLCGWQSGPCPDMETAADAYGDHRAAQGVITAAKVIGKAQQSAEKGAP